MAIAAVPSMWGRNFSLGLRRTSFRAVFSALELAGLTWEADSKGDKDKGKHGALRRIIPFGNDARRMVRSLLDRQKALADVLGDSV